MDERRAHLRERVIYGATAALGPAGSPRNCVVRNISEAGAYIEFGHIVSLPDDLTLTIARKGRSYQARVVWWRNNAAGIAFAAQRVVTPAPKTDLEERLRRSERKARQLQRRVQELTGG